MKAAADFLQGKRNGKMKAWVLHEIGRLQYENVEEPVPAKDEVIIAVKATGICGSDIPRIYRNGAHKMPLIPGHEFSGEVVQNGKGVDKKWLYKKVGVYPLIPCRKCIACQKQQYEMCRNYSYLGSRQNGGYAEYVAVPAANLIALPEKVSYEEAAMLEPMAVAVHAIKKVKIERADIVVVCGLGTIGLLLLMFLKEKGVSNILAIGNKEFQKQIFLKMGLKEDSFCDSRNQDVGKWLMEHTRGCGADVFFECVGKNETFAQAIDNAAPAGRICLVGNPYSDMALEKQTYWKILRNQLIVTGTWNSSFTGKADDEWHDILKLLEEKKIMPSELISHRFLLSELQQGLCIMKNKGVREEGMEDYVKIMGIL